MLFRSHGDNVDAFAKSTAKDWICSVEKVCEDLLQQYDKVDVIGLSLGGVLACHLASKYPINHLYLLAPALALRLKIPSALKLAKILKKLGFKHVRNRAGNLFEESEVELAYRLLPILSIIEVLTLINEFKFNPPSCPIDLFLGQHDAVVNVEKTAAFFANLPNVQTHWLANSAHVLPLDGDVDAIIDCMCKS